MKGDLNIEKLIQDFIVLPLALKIFRRDQEAFKFSKVSNVYLDKFEAMIEQLQQDINHTKKELITKHHTDVRYLDNKNEIVKYKYKDKIIEFTASELKDLTGEVMRSYLYGDKATAFEEKERGWN